MNINNHWIRLFPSNPVCLRLWAWLNMAIDTDVF